MEKVQSIRPEDHHPDCTFRKSVECSVAIECEHGYDVCPICDPCTCSPAPDNSEVKP